MKIFIIAGELSGDLHGRNLIRSLRQQKERIEIHSVGGALMESENPKSHIAMSHLAVTGLMGIIQKLPEFLKIFRQISFHVRSIKPDGIVFIDNPGFNLRLAKHLSILNIPMIYYICPQVWAWAENRVHLMKKLFKKALVIFDFEKDFYMKHSMPVEWVGHPLKELVVLSDPKKQDTNGHKLTSRRIILMPGSRSAEIKLLLPTLLKSAKLIRREMPEAEFFMIKAESLTEGIIQKYITPEYEFVHVVREGKEPFLRNADLGLICSGTATLECALFELPMVIVYRTSPISAFIFRRLIKTRVLGIPNLLLGENVVPELLQENATAEKISHEALKLLTDPSLANQMRLKLKESHSHMGEGRASERAAEEILKLI